MFRFLRQHKPQEFGFQPLAQLFLIWLLNLICSILPIRKIEAYVAYYLNDAIEVAKQIATALNIDVLHATEHESKWLRHDNI